MELIFDDSLFVHYRFVYFSPADVENPDLDETRRGQVNGLLGAATGDALSFVTGTHTGNVPLRIEWHDSEPPLGDVWEDVVEASFEVAGRDMRVAAFDDAREVRVPATGSHRVRFCASGFEAGSRDEFGEDETVPDRYLLQMWPASPTADVIVRVGSTAAQYWHDVAQEVSAIPEQDWAVQRAAAAEPPMEYDPWRPSVGLGLSDENLLRDIPISLRLEMTAPMARMACNAMDIGERQPLRSALEALREHRPLPASMTTVSEVMSNLVSQLDLPATRLGVRASAPDINRIEAAVRAVFAAADPDSVMNLGPLLALVKAATGTSGEAIVQQICMDLGYG